jgi:hypothetical protein
MIHGDRWMPDHDDELSRLRHADPVDQASIPAPDAPGPRALRERIMMSPTARRTPWIAAAAAAVILITGGAVLASRIGNDPKPRPPVALATTPGGTSIGSCVETYSLQTLVRRAVAFDGTVSRVQGDEITFRVNEAFHGVDGSQATLKGASTIGGITSAGSAVSLEPGTRLLVAGDGGFAWSCGFTQPYQRSVADQWREAFAG